LLVPRSEEKVSKEPGRVRVFSVAIPLVYNKAGAYMHPFIFRKVSIMLDKIEKAGILEWTISSDRPYG